jgi:multidrug efflux system outer membrane protein
MIRPFYLLPAFAIALTACKTVGPDHEIPGMTLPVSFSQGGTQWKRHSPEQLPKSRPWWRLYKDPTLSALVERSLASNQEIAAAGARVRQARSLSQVARSRYFPAIDMGASAERSRSRFRGDDSDGGGSATLENRFTVPLTFSYELDLWGGRARQVESAEASAAAAAETLNALGLTVATEVALTYWALRAVDADRALLARTVELRREALGLLTRQRDAGAISGLDLSRAETEVSTAEADRIGLDRDRIELVNALAVLTGSAASGSKVPERTELPAPPQVPVSVPSELLRQRPDIRAAERRVAAANAEIGVATAAFYPSVSLGASTGLDAVQVSDLFKSPALVWSVGPSATLPLTGRKLLAYQRDATVAAHEEASADYRQTLLNSMREVENALQGSLIVARQQQAQEDALGSARQTMELSSTRFKAGLVSFLDVVDAERTRLDAERRTNAARAERLAISVALIKALGGEWR